MYSQVVAPASAPKRFKCEFGCGFGGEYASVAEHEKACGPNRAAAAAAAAEQPAHSGASVPLKKHQRVVYPAGLPAGVRVCAGV
jgi:hypothetical protein